MTFQEYLKNRKNGSGSAADSVSIPENKFQAYVARRKAGNWASSADTFIQKIQSDYSARQQGSYQSPESIQEYKKSVSSELQELLDGVKDAKKYASQITDEEEREKYEKAVSDTQHYLQSVDWRLDLEERYWDKWDSEDSYNQWKKEYDRQKELDSYQQSILSRPDFEEYAQKGAATENISLRDATDARGQFRSGSDELIGNKVTFTRDNAQSRPWETAAHSSIKPDIEERYTYMTDDEVSVYNYLLAKEGEEKADEYLATLTPYLNYRQGEDMAEKRKGSFLDTVGLSLTSGLDQFISGVRGWFTQEAEPVSATQIAAELARENISSDIGKFAFDAGRVLGNMAPSIALGMVTGGVGSAAGLGTAGVQMANAVGTGLSVGASAGGNNYQQALREGYSVPQARTYGLTTGALEAGLQTVLGATAKGAGLVTSKVSSSLSNLVKSASQKVAVKVGMSALGEGFEEYLQEILNPVVRNLTLGEDNEFQLFTEEALYNGMLGAITGGLFSAADAGASRVSNPFFSVYGTEGSVSTQTDESGNVLGYMHFNRQGDIDGYVRVAKDGEAAIHKPFTSYENIQAYAYVDKDGVTQYGRVNADGEVVTGSFRPNDTSEADTASSVEADAVSSAETATGSVDTHAANIPALYQLAQEAAANRQATPAGTAKGAVRTNGTPAADGESIRAASARPEDTIRAATSGQQGGTIANTGIRTDHTAEANAVLAISGQEAAPVTVSGIGSVEDGNVRVTLSGGETVSLEDVSFDSQEMESLYYAASDYTTPTARAFVSGYTGELPLKTYKVAFDFIRSQAREGVSFDTAVKQAGLAGQMMGLEAQQLAWYSGVNETAALHKVGENGTISTTKEGSGDNGEEEIHIRQYQGSAGGPDGRGKQSAGQRSGVSETDGGIHKTSRKVAGGIQEEKPRQRITLPSNEGNFTFDSIETDFLTAKQKSLAQKSAEYGYELHYFTKGTVFNDGEEDRIIDKQAFMIPGLNAIFAMDGQDIDFLYHELFHQFFDENKHGEQALVDRVKDSIIKDCAQHREYRKRAEQAYNTEIPDELLIEEITADLCEYAMSGSEQMHRRLDGLFPDGMLEKLAEQARDVFAANRKEEKEKNAEETSGVRYSLEGYTEHQKENWANSKSIVLYESQEQLERFIDDALDKRNLNKKLYFGRIPNELAERVMRETGINIKGYNCTIQAQEIRKILLHSHGDSESEQMRGQRAVTREDILQIPEVIESPDIIRLSSKLYEGKPVLQFVKTIEGKTTVVSYVSKKHRDLAVQTMYAGIKKGSLATATDAPTSGPLSLTSETTVGTASNNSIAKSVNTVNDSLSQSGAGVIWETPENEVSEWIRDQAAVLDAIGKEFGYRFLIRSSLLGGKANGQTVPGSREIVLSADSMEEALLYWAGHEVIHDLQVSYPEGYEEISRQVLEYLGQQERFDLNRRKQQLIREYRRGGLELTEEEAEEEIVCNGAAVAFADEDFIRGCAERNRSLLEWLKEKLNSLLARIREVLARLTRTNPEVRAYAKAPLETLTRLQQSVETALRESAGRAGGRQSFRRSMTTRTSTDSQGRTLSPEQEEFFRNSAIRDKDGHLQVMYHATDAQFTVFDKKKQGTVTDGGIWGRGFYFDVEESFALEFGSKATAYYLNVARPYRTTYEATCGEIMELFRENGIRIRFRMDPEEGLNRFIRRFGYKKFSEALRFLGYDGVFVSGNECAVYEPNQIKRIDNLSPTEQEDVRYAAKEKRGLRYSLQNVDGADIDSLTEENEALRRQVELLKQEFRLTEGHQVSKAAVEGLAAKVLRQTKSVYDKDTLAGNLQTVFRYIANDPEANFQETMEVLTDIAGSVLQESTSMNRDLYNEYADMREYFRKTPLSLSEAAKAELTDGYADFRSRNFGMLNLRSGGTLLNELWGEICEKWPQFFDADLAETEQPYAVVDALNAVKPAYINPYGMNNADAARDLAMQLYYEYFELPEVHTFADKHKAELEKLRAEYRRKLLDARSAARDQYNKRLKEVQEWNAGKRRELSKKIRETENAKRKQQLAAQYRRLMDRKAEQLERQKAKFRTQREIREANRREREEIRKLRTRIRSIADELSRRLVKETDQKNIPEDFKKPVAELLSMLDFTTDRTKSDSQASRRLRDLQAAYAKLESATQGEETPLTDYFDPDILNMIEEVAGLVEGKRVVDLGVQELSRLKDLLKSISTIVHNAGRLFREDKAVTVAEAGKEAIRVLNAKKQFRRAKIAEGENNPFGFMSDLLGKGMLTPYYFFKQFEGTPVWELFQKLYDGENVYVRLSNRALKFARETMKKHGYWNWKLHERRKIGKEEAISFRTVNGDEIKLTLGEMLSLYATARRENMVETHHLDKGGFTLGSKDGAQRGILFTSADFQKLCGMLTEEQINCADEMVEYLSTVCAEQGNEVSLKMFGIRKFQEKYYFPFKVSGNVIRSNPGESQDIRLKNRSFTKARTDRATAPLMIQDFFEVWAGHVEEMAMYNAFALPLEDFTRVWNYRYQGDPGLSVKFAIEGAFGKRANSYITNFLRDLNGGVLQPVGEEWFSRVVSTFKKVSVLANLSVAIQQVSAIVRATAMINPKYLAPRSVSQARLFREYDEARRYVPVYILKDWGYFDTNMTRGTYQRMIQQEYQGAGKIKGFFTDSNYRSDAYGILAQKGDEANWGQLWYAVKNETRERHPEVRYGSEEFYQLAAERVTDIIRATQVYDSVFKRSEIMRSTGAAAKMATAFMAEPITSYNMLLDAAKEAGSGKKGSKKKAARIIVCVVSCMLVGKLLESVISAMRDDDDEKKDENGNIVGTRSFWDKYRDAVLDNLWDDPLGMIPFVRDIVSIAQGYEVKRTDMELFQKLYYALTKLDSDKYTTAEKADAVIGAVAALFGEPYANISRDARAIYHTFFADNVNDGTASYRGYLLYRSVLEGDKETYQELYNGYREDGKTDKEIQGVLRSALATYSPLISESVAAKLNGDLNAYEADIQKMIQSGFQREMVIDAVKNFEQKLKTIAGYRVDGKTEEAEKALAKLFPPEVDEETRKTIEARIDTLTEKKAAEPEEEEEETSSSLYTYTDLCEAIERGESDNVSRILQDMRKNGKEDKTIRTQVTRYFKPLYIVCYQNRDKEGMKKIEKALYALDLGYDYKDFDAWTDPKEDE